MTLQKISHQEFQKNIKGSIAIVLSEFNSEIGGRLLAGAEEVLEQYPDIQWQVHFVPGAFEIPLMAQKLASLVKVNEDESETRVFDVIIAIGCVIKGETRHFELVADNCARGCMDVMLSQDIPVVFEVLAGTKEQVKERSRGEFSHGKLAAYTALHWLKKFV